ncbi:MAG: MtrB/PioB family outer membrane beta-barrel protein, partial [Thermodesulfovibrionales bacterium]
MRSFAILCLLFSLASSLAFAQDIEVSSPSSEEPNASVPARERAPENIPAAAESQQEEDIPASSMTDDTASPFHPPSLLEEKDHIYAFPMIDAHYGLSLGGRYAEVDGPKWLSEAEYEYIHDSLTFGGKATAFPFPHRIHLELEYLNHKDYYGDASYAYGDAFLFRWISNTVFHNLENITLMNPGGDPAYSVSIFDPAEDYGKRTGINRFALRYKTNDFPFHVYVLGDWITADGTRQQRFLGGSGFFNDLVRSSQKRDIDWNIRDITVGVNSHVGPVEIDYGHSEKRVHVGDSDMTYTYAAGAGRPAGTYQHNLIPETKRSMDTLKMHTSYTGRLFVSGTLQNGEGENESNGASADYFTGSAEARWLPLHAITITARYRHHENDVDNPSQVTLSDLSDPTSSQTYSVRDSISSKTDAVSSSVRVRLSKKVTVHTEYSHKNIDRDNADEWALASTTVKDKVLLRVRARPLKTLTLKA